MRIGIFSDTHDNLVAIDKALTAFEDTRAEAIIHAGDFCSPFALQMIVDRVEVPLYAVFGNNDGERHGLARLVPELRDGPRHFELGEKKFCLIHDTEKLSHEDEMASDIIVCGHTHAGPRAELHGETLYVEAGECCGWLTGLCRVSILDTATLAVQNQVVHEQERPGK